MQYCRICGNPLENNETVCPLCGAPTTSSRDMRSGVAALFGTVQTDTAPSAKPTAPAESPAQPQEAAPAPQHTQEPAVAAAEPAKEPAADVPEETQPMPVSHFDEDAAYPASEKAGEETAPAAQPVSGTAQPENTAQPELPAPAEDDIAQALSEFLSTVANDPLPAQTPAPKAEPLPESSSEAPAEEPAAAPEAPHAEPETTVGQKSSKKQQKKEQKAAQKAAKQAEKAAKKAAAAQTKRQKQQPADAPLRGSLLGKGGALFILLMSAAAVVAAIVMIVVPLWQQRQAQQQSETDAYLTYLCGSWLSEPFTYAEDEASTPIREMLVLEDDYTFSSTNYASPNDRDTYDPATWTACDATAGSWALELETASIRFYYQREDGSTYVYRRYIRDLTSASLVMREYYNEQMTDYYDVVFTPAEG